MPKNKKFIDRKNSVTFHVVHRSQQDPLTADESAPQRVLVPIKDKIPRGEKDKIKEEQQKYGIFYDDDYNYLQHLRDSDKIEVDWEQVEKIDKNDKTDKSKSDKINLPSSVFASNVEENVGLLNKAAPHSGLRLDLDPDIVAALDDDFNYDDPENELEDNFMELANAEKSDSEYNSEDESDFNDYSDEDNDEICSLNGPQYTFADEETKSRFTEYSMSSSVIRRNEQLTLLDDRFEKMYESYDDPAIGPLDCEEIEGYVDPNSALLLQCADEFARQRKRQQLEKDTLALKLKLSQIDDSDSDDDEDLVKMEVKDDKEKWDCESILSTYSNIYNYPKLISEPKNNNQKIKINPRTGMPVNILGQNKLTAHNLSQLNSDQSSNGPKSIGGRSVISQLSVLSIRPKDESPEERKQRKTQLKEYRKCRREERKANAEAFKEEAKRQNKIAINNRNNIQGNRIL